MDSRMENSFLRWCIENQTKLLLTFIVMIVTFCFAFFERKKKPKKREISPDSVKARLAAFEPVPLCPPISKSANLLLKNPIILESSSAKYSKLKGDTRELLSLVSMDFLGFGHRKEQRKAALDALNKYGCGSCGPRGFYGTIDVHVFLEDKLSEFFGTEGCVAYSDDLSTIQSVIPAFSNKEDVLLVDNGCNDTVLSGVVLSRASVYYFRHNDMNDLEKMLGEVNRKSTKNQRKFIVIEGIYRNYGDIAPLDKIVKLKQQYKWRLFVDESLSMFVLGETGRGLSEHFDIPINNIELLAGSLNTTIASIGGFSVGRKVITDHQKLYGAGYVFSASSPPFVSTAAISSIDLLMSEGAQKLDALRKKIVHAHEQLKVQASAIFETSSSKLSPIIHLRLVENHCKYVENNDDEDDEKRYREEEILEEISFAARQKGVLVRKSAYVSSNYNGKQFKRPKAPRPSLRIVLTSEHEESEIDQAIKTIVDAAKDVLKV